jgi:hypothetical protein
MSIKAKFCEWACRGCTDSTHRPAVLVEATDDGTSWAKACAARGLPVRYI